jgi:hypothetical protein
MTALAEGRVDLDQEARRFGVLPDPGDYPPPLGSTPAPRQPLFGTLAGPGGPLVLESLAERLGPVLEG